MRTFIWTAAAALGIATIRHDASAQLPSASPYRTMDSAVVVGPGNTVHVVARAVTEFRSMSAGREPSRRHDITYVTSIPVSDSTAVRQQADGAARVFGPAALRYGARGLGLTICNMNPCTMPATTTWIGYAWSDSSWRRVPVPSRRANAPDRRR